MIHTFTSTAGESHAAVMSNADTWTHLAKVGTAPGARVSLCGYSAVQLREASARDLNHNPDSTLGIGFCPSCAAKVWPS